MRTDLYRGPSERRFSLDVSIFPSEKAFKLNGVVSPPHTGT